MSTLNANLVLHLLLVSVGRFRFDRHGGVCRQWWPRGHWRWAGPGGRHDRHHRRHGPPSRRPPRPGDGPHGAGHRPAHLPPVAVGRRRAGLGPHRLLQRPPPGGEDDAAAGGEPGRGGAGRGGQPIHRPGPAPARGRRRRGARPARLVRRAAVDEVRRGGPRRAGRDRPGPCGRLPRQRRAIPEGTRRTRPGGPAEGGDASRRPGGCWSRRTTRSVTSPRPTGSRCAACRG